MIRTRFFSFSLSLKYQFTYPSPQHLTHTTALHRQTTRLHRPTTTFHNSKTTTLPHPHPHTLHLLTTSLHPLPPHSPPHHHHHAYRHLNTGLLRATANRPATIQPGAFSTAVIPAQKMRRRQQKKTLISWQSMLIQEVASLSLRPCWLCCWLRCRGLFRTVICFCNRLL